MNSETGKLLSKTEKFLSYS